MNSIVNTIQINIPTRLIIKLASPILCLFKCLCQFANDVLVREQLKRMLMQKHKNYRSKKDDIGALLDAAKFLARIVPTTTKTITPIRPIVDRIID